MSHFETKLLLALFWLYMFLPKMLSIVLFQWQQQMNRGTAREKYSPKYSFRALKHSTPGGGTPIHYIYGYVPPKGVVILKLLI